MKDRKILVVEDENKIADIVRAYLERDGFIVVRPAGRTHLEVQVLYRPDRGNC